MNRQIKLADFEEIRSIQLLLQIIIPKYIFFKAVEHGISFIYPD